MILANVNDWGIFGDDSFDWTSRLEQVIGEVSETAVIFFPKGTYILDSVTVDKDVSFELAPGAVLKHKPNASGAMLHYTAAATGSVQGGTLDGNHASQTGALWHPLIRTFTHAIFQVRDAAFQNYNFAAIRDQDSTGELQVIACRFLNGAEHGGIKNVKQSTGIDIICEGAAFQDARPFLRVNRCRFEQDGAPSSHGMAPGGIIVHGDDSVNCHPSVDISDNFFRNVGQDAYENHIGAIDLYEDVLNAMVCNNIIVNARYNAIKLQNCGRLLCTGNICEGNDTGDTYSGILYDPAQRTDAHGLYEDAIIAHNIIRDSVSTLGITIQGLNASARRISIDTNHVHCSQALRVQGAFGVEAPFLIKGNTLRGVSTSHPAVSIENVTGVIRVTDNDVRGTRTAFRAATGLSGAYFHFSGNYFETSSGDYDALNLEGAAGAYFHSGEYNHLASGQAVLIRADASSNPIGELMFGPDNIIRNGTAAMVNINSWRGIVSAIGTPEGAIQAPVGTLYRRINGSTGTTLYVKEGGVDAFGWGAK